MLSLQFAWAEREGTLSRQWSTCSQRTMLVYTHYCGVGVHYFTPLVGWALDGLGREESSQTIIKRFLVLLTAAFFFSMVDLDFP